MNHGPYHVIKRQTEEARGVFQIISSIFLNQMAYVVGIMSSLFNIPQVISIWSHQNATGVSALSWSGFALASLFWLFYAIHHKEKALIVTFGLSLFFQVVIVVGAVLY
jgi:uncharacterized protein with PQ loop repeat